jgi:hypothetical protein
MTSGNLNAGPDSTRLGPRHVLDAMAELLRDLHKLLESYAPTWYTEDVDTRIRATLAMLTLARTHSQSSLVGNRSIPPGVERLFLNRVVGPEPPK